jgi:hypothetical protein
LCQIMDLRPYIGSETAEPELVFSMPKAGKDLPNRNSERHSLTFTSGVGIPHRSPVKRSELKEKQRVESLGSSTLKISLFDALDK